MVRFVRSVRLGVGVMVLLVSVRMLWSAVMVVYGVVARLRPHPWRVVGVGVWELWLIPWVVVVGAVVSGRLLIPWVVNLVGVVVWRMPTPWSTLVCAGVWVKAFNSWLLVVGVRAVVWGRLLVPWFIMVVGAVVWVRGPSPWLIVVGARVWVRLLMPWLLLVLLVVTSLWVSLLLLVVVVVATLLKFVAFVGGMGEGIVVPVACAVVVGGMVAGLSLV